MSDAWILEYGTNVAARDRRGHMLPEARRAHERLASLPKRQHISEHRSRSDIAREKSDRVRSTTMLSGGYVRGPAPSVAPPSETYKALKTSIDAASKARKPRKKRDPSTYGARPNQWGYTHGEPLKIMGGRSAGQQGTYVGAANSRDVYVLIDGVRKAVGAHLVRRARG